MNKGRKILSTRIPKYGLICDLITTAICLILLNIILCPSAQARNRGRMQQGKTTGEIVSMMKERLGLSEEQVAQVRPIMEDEKNLRQQILEKYIGQNRESMMSVRPEIEELQAYTEARLSKVLTDEQMEKYRKIRDEETQKRREMRSGRSGMRGGRGGGKRRY